MMPPTISLIHLLNPLNQGTDNFPSFAQPEAL